MSYKVKIYLNKVTLIWPSFYCQCLDNYFMGVAGDKCEFRCPYYAQDTDNDGQCDG